MAGAATPFRRTWLARGLAAWVLAILVYMLAYGRIEEVAGTGVVSDAQVWMAASALGLAAWCLVVSFRRPRVGLNALGLLVVLCASVVWGFNILLYAGGYLNFLSHRGAYDRIVADAKAGRLPPPDAEGRVRGRRSGVTFDAHLGAQPTVYFWWTGPSWTAYGVVYDEADCPWRPYTPPPEPPFPAASEVAPPSPPPPQATDSADPPTIKSIGSFQPPSDHSLRPQDDRWRLAGHYCLTTIRIVW